MSQTIDLREVKDRILKDKDWQSRIVDIEIFHSHLLLIRKKWSIRKTAKVLGLCASTVCEDLMLAKFSLDDPSITKYRRRKDALKIVRRYE